MNASLLAFAALVPLAAGPLPQEEKALTLALCGGGAITIPLGGSNKGDEAPMPDCDPKACHAATCREKDRGKGFRTGI